MRGINKKVKLEGSEDFSQKRRGNRNMWRKERMDLC